MLHISHPWFIVHPMHAYMTTGIWWFTPMFHIIPSYTITSKWSFKHGLYNGYLYDHRHMMLHSHGLYNTNLYDHQHMIIHVMVHTIATYMFINTWSFLAMINITCVITSIWSFHTTVHTMLMWSLTYDWSPILIIPMCFCMCVCVFFHFTCFCIILYHDLILSFHSCLVFSILGVYFAFLYLCTSFHTIAQYFPFWRCVCVASSNWGAERGAGGFSK
jgi:hypothetical protein